MILVIFGFISALFLYLSWRTAHNTKPVNLWANDTSEIKVKDTHQYNLACSRLLAGYGILLLFIGFLVQSEQMILIILAILLTVFASLGLMIIYTYIEGKYRL